MSVAIVVGADAGAEERKPFWAKCVKCKHIWPAAYFPMELTAIGKLLKGLRCPMCAASSKDITPAKQDGGVLKEPIIAAPSGT